ncbi:MAG: DUF1844 domain-containing protein [Acidobacteria bacterium]|nr:DUF1844 domain-containing protein [Acidobacteriota bacterium]
MSKDKHDETFKVIDRRLFNEEGRLREEALEEERAQQKKSDLAAAAQKPAAPSPSSPATTSTAAPTPAPAADAPKSSRNFRMLLGLLANQAEACLGGAPDPVSGQAFLDLQGASTIIDIFDDLTERTRGNLAADDNKLLLDIIGSLKVTYLEMEKVAAQMAAKEAGGMSPAGPRKTR